MQILPLNLEFIKTNWNIFQVIEEKSGLSRTWTIENFTDSLPNKWELSKIILSDNLIIGYAILSEKSSVCAHLHRIVIAPDHQRNGIGSVFLSSIIDGLASMYNFLTLKVESEDTKSFYTKLGFLPLFSTEHSTYLLRVIK